jgi:hypothetical protein
MPVAHAILQALEDVEGVLGSLPPENLWKSPGGQAATIGFHVRHLAGSLDRLFTYARGEALSEDQRAVAKAEEGTLDEPRPVGRDKLPSSVRGLLYHAGEHAVRHAGQIVTTAKILEGAAP